MKLLIACLCLACSTLSTQPLFADSLEEAHRLLRVANVEHHYQARTTEQTRAIIRTYSSIVSMSVAVNLPVAITQQISNCYSKVYAWENFKEGLAQVLADNLTLHELQLLIDFYDNLGLPPSEIQNFKDTIAKSSLIQAASLEFMWANSANCVEHDTRLILDYVATQITPAEAALAVD